MLHDRVLYDGGGITYTRRVVYYNVLSLLNINYYNMTLWRYFIIDQFIVYKKMYSIFIYQFGPSSTTPHYGFLTRANFILLGIFRFWLTVLIK